jgi:hypothetical protein
VIVRGSGDRENVVVRDSDPRVGERSLVDVPMAEWVGQILDVGMMKTSTITSATSAMFVSPPKVPHGGGFRAPAPPYYEQNPEITPQSARGTRPGMSAQASPAARQVVVGQPEQAAIPYPERHVMYVENICQLLRSIQRRETLFDDCTPQQRERLRASLSDATTLLAQVRSKLKL